jgi:two-component system chemotaxis response regulator CheB
MLPVITGVAVTEYVMAFCPTPILIVSASTNRGELFKTYDALAAGAVDVLDKPYADTVDARWAESFLAAVRLVSRIKVITHIRARLRGASPPLAPLPGRSAEARPPRAALIGASTGGPAALVQILRALPVDYRLPILLTMHIGEPFGVALADWLDGLSNLRVRCARDRDPLPPVGEPGVIMAPPLRHLVVEQGRLRLTNDPERHSCRPSVDVLFESAARELGGAAVGCLLTGMGRDGAAGLLALRQSGAHTIAQDEASSVVFGMPRAAIEIGAAEQVLPLDLIAAALVGALQGRAQ